MVDGGGGVESGVAIDPASNTFVICMTTWDEWGMEDLH